MEPSSELRDLVAASLEAISRGDLGAFADHVSRQEGTHALGTDPAEWWPDRAGLLRGATEAVGAGAAFATGEVLVWREGSVGWAVAPAATIRLPDGGEVGFRFTGVDRREEGEMAAGAGELVDRGAQRRGRPHRLPGDLAATSSQGPAPPARGAIPTGRSFSPLTTPADRP
jgi:hypothetical protein